MKAETDAAALYGLLKAARLLVFDFDGTLVDSNEIKWYGFEYAFRNFPDRLDEIMSYCRGSNHTIRGEKFRYVYESILGLPYTADVEQLLHHRYAGATIQAVIDAPDIPGATEFLHGIEARYDTAVLSSTPHDILLKTLDARNWRRYFKVIQGAPINKAAWLRNHRDVVFFGDTREDLESSRSAECRFVGVRNFELQNEPDCYFISDFTVLL